MVSPLPLNTKPCSPLTTSDHVLPPLIEYCHFEKLIFCNTGLNLIVFGVYVSPPSVDLNT